MGCVQTKAAAPTTTAAAAAASAEELPNILRSRSRSPTGAASSLGNGVKHVKSGAAGVASHVGHGAVDALRAVGHGAQHVGHEAAGVARQAGHGAKVALSAVGHEAHHIGSGAAGAVRHVGHEVVGVVRPTRITTQDIPILPQVEKSWLDQLYDQWLSLNPWYCCCQPAAGSNLLGSLVKSLIESFDSSTLGVEVEIGSMVLDPSIGRVQIDGLTICNPEGYHSEYLLHANKVVIDIDMEKLLYSFGKELHVEELVFDGINVNYEQGLHSSNLHDLQKQLESKPDSNEHSNSNGQSETNAHSDSNEQEENATTSEVKLVLHTILAQNIGARLATKLTRGHGPRVEVATIRYDDFDTEVGAERSSKRIARILIRTLIKSVLATVIGTKCARAVVGAAHRVADKAHGAAGKLKATSSGPLEKIKAVSSGSRESLCTI